MIFTGNSKNLKIDAYESCPCGSTKKFKFCCYQIARKVRDDGYKSPNYSESRMNHMVHETWEKADFKVCLAFDSKRCNGTIKGAHSIQNNRILNRISQKGHVLQIAHKLTNVGPEVDLKKISKNKASTFFGFCDFHDTDLFKPIELEEYTNQEIQNFLFAFRAHAIEYHRKLRRLNHHSEIFKMNPSQMLSNEGVYVYRVAQLDVKDCEENHQMFREDYVNGNYSNIRTIYRKLNYEIKFAVSSSFAVRFDLEQNVINDIYSIEEEEMPSIYLNVYPVENATNILISYHLKDNAKYKRFFDQLEALTNEKLVKYLNYVIIEYTENVFFHPDLINSLNDKEKKSLLESFVSSMNVMKRMDLIIDENYYKFDLFKMISN